MTQNFANNVLVLSWFRNFQKLLQNNVFLDNILNIEKTAFCLQFTSFQNLSLEMAFWPALSSTTTEALIRSNFLSLHISTSQACYQTRLIIFHTSKRMFLIKVWPGTGSRILQKMSSFSIKRSELVRSRRTTNPKPFWKMSGAHKLDNFRSKFNQIKIEYQRDTGKLQHSLANFKLKVLYFDVLTNFVLVCSCGINKEDEPIAARCSLNDEKTCRNKARLNSAKPSNFDRIRYASVNEPTTVSLLHVKFDWVKPGTTAKRFTVAIVLPSGVKATSTARVSWSDHSILTWLGPLVNLKQEWLLSTRPYKIEVYRPKLVVLWAVFKTILGKISTILKFTLSFPFQFRFKLTFARN